MNYKLNAEPGPNLIQETKIFSESLALFVTGIILEL